MTLTMRQAVEVVYQRWASLWGLPGAAAIPYCLENQPFAELETGAGPWCRLSVRHTASRQDSLGAPGDRRFQRRGVASVQIFTPAAEGVGAGLAIAQTARAIFEGESVGGVDFGDAQSREIGTDGRWFQINVEAGFTYYEQK